MKIKWSKERFIVANEILILLVIVFLIVIPSGRIYGRSISVYLTFFLNGSIWTTLLISTIKKHPFSFAMIHWCFCLFFFFFAPLVQYYYGQFPWIISRSDEILFKANELLLLWTGGVLFGQHTNKLNKKIQIQQSKNSLHTIKSTIDLSSNIKRFLLVAVTITMWRVMVIGIGNLMSRATSWHQLSSNSSIQLLLENIMQAAMYFSVIIVISLNTQNKRYKLINILMVVLLLISYPPTGMARYAAAAIYLGLILTVLPKFRRKSWFIILFMGAYMIILPFLNAFRYVSFENVDIGKVMVHTFDNFSITWIEGDYDAYVMFTLAIEYVKKNGITWMHQFLGAILFWIPRSIWPEKPIGSGAFMAGKLNWTFTNLSCPLPGEAILNLGILGIIIFSIMLGRMIIMIDDLYWNGNTANTRIIDLLYPVLLIFFFFMCRGDMMSSVAYMASYFVVGYILIPKCKS